MLLCPVLCHPPKLRMEIAGTKVAISGGHLDSRVAQDAAQVVKIAPVLDEPACKCVAQVVPPNISQAGPLACGHKAVLHIDESAAVSLCEQKWAIRPLRLIKQSLDRGDRFIAERHAPRNTALGV